MPPVLIVPGLGGSGPAHWQSRWEELERGYRRVSMPDWDRPDLTTWVSTLAAAVHAAPVGAVIVAHSLGCLAVAHWAGRGGKARGALLVAVPDPEAPAFPEVAGSFRPVPLAPIGFPTRVVASRDDPYASFEFAQRCATAWRSQLTDIGCAGHINADSGLGAWAEGRQLLSELTSA
jgi:predicted alpha/beta hydrolase family esterase